MKHQYKINVEYNSDQGFHPVSVCVTRGGDDVAEFHGAKLDALLHKAARAIAEEETKET